MALFRKFFYRKPPDGLLEISERVYVFDCCFATDVSDEDAYKVGGIVGQLRDHFPDAEFMVFNFREGEAQSQIASILSEFELSVIDYPRQYEGCPLLTMEKIHSFLSSGESWLSRSPQNFLLMHCERGGWPVLAFMLAALLVYRKQYPGEQRTLDMIYKQAPRGHSMSPLNPLPSQLRYLHYISRRNVSLEWPPHDRALTLDCVILRFIPNFDGMGGCRPIFRIHGPDPLTKDSDMATKVLFSTPKSSNIVRVYKQEDCELVKIDIHCHIQGDVVLECISLDEELEHEEMMFRVMFNTAFIRSNILILDRDSIDMLWNAKDRFPKDFRAEVLLSEMDAGNPSASLDLTIADEKEGLPIEAFDKVKEIFNLDWLELKPDTARVLQQIASSRTFRDPFGADSPLRSEADSVLGEESPHGLHEEYPYGETDNSQKKLLSSSTKKHFFSTHNPTEVKIVSQRIHLSRSIPAFSSMSQPGSQATVSRFHSAPSALGIMALLDDHTVSDIPEDTHATKLTSPGATSSASGSSISTKPSQPQSLRSLTLNSASYTREAEPARSCPSRSRSLNFASYTKEAEYIPVYSLPPASPTPPAPPRPPPLMPRAKVASLASPPLPPSPPPPLSRPPKVGSLTTPHLPPPPPPAPSKVGSVGPPPPPPPLPPSGTAKEASSPPPPPPSPPPPTQPISSLSPAIAAAAPSPPPPPPTASTSIMDVDTVYKQLSSSKPPIRAIKSSISEVPSPTKKLSDLVRHSSLPSQPSHHGNKSPDKVKSTSIAPPRPPPLPCKGTSSVPASSGLERSVSSPVIPSPPPPPLMTSLSSDTNILPSGRVTGTVGIPSPPPPPCLGPAAATSAPPPPPPPCPNPAAATLAPPPPPPPCRDPAAAGSAPPPPPPPCRDPAAAGSAPPPPVPPCTLRSSPGGKGANGEVIPPPPPGGLGAPSKGRLRKNMQSGRKTNLKPLHWVKVTRAVKGSLWAETQNPDEFSKPPEFDMSELESLFSAAAPNSGLQRSGSKGARSAGPKSDKVHLIDLRRANNCEIMLTKVKIPLNELMSSVLALDDSLLDVDQVDNLIKFCPTKEEMELLKGYSGDKENLGKCEQYFLELMRIPRVESKLRVFSFKIQFNSEVSDLKSNLNVVNSSAEEIRSSVKLKRIMQTILSLGNALNQGTARGAAVGFRLDSLLKLTDTRARNNKMTLMHYLCKVLAEKLPELLDFPKDLVSLEVASKMQLKCLAEEMQAINKGLEKVEQELTASENDGGVSQVFCKTLRDFLAGAEAEVRSLTSVYSNVGRNADALALYFGEDPARCPFEQVVSTLNNFVRMFVRAHDENCKQLEQEKKKAKETENEKPKVKQSKETEE